MKRFSFLVCLALLLLVVQTGIASADTGADSTTTTAERTGGSIYFETYPNGATIWLDNLEIGTTAITYFSEKTGTLEVRIHKKGYEDYTGQVTVTDGKRTDFFARLTPLSGDLSAKTTTVTPVITATTIRKSTMSVPTSWPTPTPASPVDPAVVIGAAAVGIGLFAIRPR